MSLSPSLFFPFYLHIFFLPSSMRHLRLQSVGVWVMCFLLLASSRIASLVCLAPALPSLYDVFWLCLTVCLSMPLSVCLFGFVFIFQHCQPIYQPLSILYVSLFAPPVCIVVFHMYFSFLAIVLRRVLFLGTILHISFFVCMPLCFHLQLPLLWQVSWSWVWFEMWCLPCFSLTFGLIFLCFLCFEFFFFC